MKLSRKQKMRRASRKRASRRSTRRSQRGGQMPTVGKIYLMRNSAGVISNITKKGALEGSAVDVTSAGANQITVSNIPATMGKLADVKFSGFSGSWVQLAGRQELTRVNMPGTSAIAIESDGKPVRRPRAKKVDANTQIPLPAVLSTVTIRNLDASNLGLVSDASDPANGNTNICVDLIFA